VLVAIFSHQVVVNVTAAAQQSQRFVQTQTVLPVAARQQIGASLAKTVEAAKQDGGTSLSVSGALAGAPSAAPDTPMAREQAKLTNVIGGLFRDDIAKSFRLSYYAAAVVAFLALIPALFTGRRLGEHEGHEAMSRAERVAGAT
jgi:hypothetical protein